MIRSGTKHYPRGVLGSFLALCVLVLASCAQSGASGVVDFNATLSGVDLADTAPNDPVRLTDTETTTLDLELTNVSADPVTVRFIQFEGQVLDMVFLTYDTGVRVELEPGETVAVPSIQLDFFDLGDQASGYLRGNVHLFDPDRELIASEEVFLDADAEGFSTLALFNVLLLLLTLGGLAWNLVRLAQRRLPANRFVRAMRFLAVGAAAGLTLAVAFSTLRLWPLDTLGWVLFTAVGAGIGYAAGFVLPGADDEALDELEDEELIEAILDAEAEAAEEAATARETNKLGTVAATAAAADSELTRETNKLGAAAATADPDDAAAEIHSELTRETNKLAAVDPDDAATDDAETVGLGDDLDDDTAPDSDDAGEGSRSTVVVGGNDAAGPASDTIDLDDALDDGADGGTRETVVVNENGDGDAGADQATETTRDTIRLDEDEDEDEDEDDRTVLVSDGSGGRDTLPLD